MFDSATQNKKKTLQNFTLFFRESISQNNLNPISSVKNFWVLMITEGIRNEKNGTVGIMLPGNIRF